MRMQQETVSYSSAIPVPSDNLSTSLNTAIFDMVRSGLRRRPKRLPSALFYDQTGSELFERICTTPEYYLTRAELDIMRTYGEEIAAALGPDIALVEYGSGSGVKTRLLLEHLQNPRAYIPVEISRSALAHSIQKLQKALPQLAIEPVCADFTQPIEHLPSVADARRMVIYFPGSTIGNLDTQAAVRLLRQMRIQIGATGGALIGFDLKKDPSIIEAAYNDAAGITAQFTLNVLRRLNRELHTDIDLDGFRHRAIYSTWASRIETHIISLREQTIHLADEPIKFFQNEAMLVEISCKYSIRGFAALAAQAGLRVRYSWCDKATQFCVQYLVPA